MKQLPILVGTFFLYLYHLLVSLLLVFVPDQFRRRKDITGQIVLITGAGSGVGRQLAVQFSKLSTCLVLLDIDKPSLLETQKLLERQSTAFVYECDVSDSEMVYEVAKRIKKEVGDVDILVNNAGIVCGKRLLDLPDKKIVKTMEVNALAHIWMCKSFLPAMIATNRGHIVCVASIVGKMASPLLTDYCASKYAAVGFAESLELELREQNIKGIKVTIVCPSQIDTRLFQGARNMFHTPLTPRYVAEEIVKGVLEEQEVIYLPNWLVLLDISNRIVPRWISVWTYEKTGAIQCMKYFKGRTEKADSYETETTIKEKLVETN